MQRRGVNLAAAGAALMAATFAGRPASLRAQQLLPVECRDSQGAGMTATAREAGTGRESAGEVLVNGKVTLRIRGGAGGMSPVQRAGEVASRLNELAAAGQLHASALAVRPLGDAAGLYAGRALILTADRQLAASNRTSPLRLAETWRDNLAGALAGRAASFRHN